jgi:damage-control phosphatase, subfamily I
MRTYFDCIPCFLRQTLDALRRLEATQAVQEKVLRSALRMVAELDLQRSPPAMAQVIHRLIREATGEGDPYREVKKQLNDFALELYPRLRRRVEDASDSFEMAVRLAAAGNVIDLGVKSGLEEAEIVGVIEDSLSAPLDAAAVEQLRSAADAAERILYVGDNAGEIVLDRLLVEQFGAAKVTFAVRGSPIINDATMDDAQLCGMTDLVEVVDSGSDAPGTILTDCSEAFRERFSTADLVLAKGQGNYETLSNVAGPIFFLLKAKCPVIARDVGLPLGSLVLKAGLISGADT